MEVQISLQDSGFISFGKIPLNEIARSYDNSVFNFSKNHCIVFHSGYTNSHFHQQYKSVPFCPHPHQHLSIAVFDNSHIHMCEVISHCESDLNFLNDLNTFSYACWLFTYLA